MKSLMQQMPYLGPEKGKAFPKGGLKEGLQKVREEDYGRLFATFSKLSSQERLDRFSAARSDLKKLGVLAELVMEGTGGLRLSMSMEFPTRDKRMDPSLLSMVHGMGFELSFERRPSRDSPQEMERFYVVRVSRGNDSLEHSHTVLERAVCLHSHLRGNVRKPQMGQLVALPTRAADAPEPAVIMERLAAAMQGTR